MKVSFTAKEYQRLLELAWLGLQVSGPGNGDDAPVAERYAELEQKLYALARSLGCADLVEGDEAISFAPTEKLTQGPAREKLTAFMEDIFWSELASRLAARDLRRELGPAKLSEELSNDDSARLEELEDRYWREFEARGVDDLVLLRGGRG